MCTTRVELGFKVTLLPVLFYFLSIGPWLHQLAVSPICPNALYFLFCFYNYHYQHHMIALDYLDV